MSTRSRSRATANAVKLAQLGAAVPQVVAHRVARMALAGPLPSARDRKEFSGMVWEKQAAFMQAWLGMAAEALRLQQRWFWGGFGVRMPSLTGAANAVAAKGIAPVHAKALGNARRLARTRLR